MWDVETTDAFDPEERFYKDMIKLADAEYRKHLNQ